MPDLSLAGERVYGFDINAIAERSANKQTMIAGS